MNAQGLRRAVSHRPLSNTEVSLRTHQIHGMGGEELRVLTVPGLIPQDRRERISMWPGFLPYSCRELPTGVRFLCLLFENELQKGSE